MTENVLTGKNTIDILGADIKNKFVIDKRVKAYVAPKRIVWESPDGMVKNSECLLENSDGQISLDVPSTCDLISNDNCASILLDFGVELQGGIQILTSKCSSNSYANLRIRFGESVMEAMSEIEDEKNATNDHAIRDMVIEVSDMSMAEIGGTGFRFIRIDLLNKNAHVSFKSIKAAFTYTDLEYKGSFRCSDELLNQIWTIGAYTVNLNIQNYVWDGIKRDRLVWIGDMHPECATIQCAFYFNDSVPKSLDFIRDETPLPKWMNDIPTYSMWWIIVHYDLFMHTGNVSYLFEQKEYMKGIYHQLSKHIGENGVDNTPDTRFMDWASSNEKQAVDAGIQAIHVLATKAIKEIFIIYGESEYVKKCNEDLKKLLKAPVNHIGNKKTASLMVMAGLIDADETNKQLLSINPTNGISTFMGYYVLKARALAGDYQGCIDLIRQYWGGMLSLGATTFWEDFDLSWLNNACRIDEICPENKIDVHGTYGDYCYKGYRNSLCHGWASGPTPWLSEHVLGVKVLEPGCKKVKISPNLCDLDWAEGTYPTPYGIIKIRSEKQSDGEIVTVIECPSEIKVIKE